MDFASMDSRSAVAPHPRLTLRRRQRATPRVIAKHQSSIWRRHHVRLSKIVALEQQRSCCVLR